MRYYKVGLKLKPHTYQSIAGLFITSLLCWKSGFVSMVIRKKSAKMLGMG